MNVKDTLLPPEPAFSRPECRISGSPVPYEEAVSFMEERVKGIREGTAEELLWFLEHPPLYTAGTSAKAEDLLQNDKLPVYKAGRGGEYTYHGPGQRVVYLMLDLKKRGADIRCFVRNVENWMIASLAEFNIQAKISEGRVGVWVPRPELGAGREDKIGAIGIRVRRWVSFHGLALNVEPDLSHFGGIVPCGITDQGVTSLVDLGYPVTMEDVDAALLKSFRQAFTACDA
ncbi:MAG: lipoyl(octanoyl) transferase LipB [Parvibaculales bacterium]